MKAHSIQIMRFLSAVSVLVVALVSASQARDSNVYEHRLKIVQDEFNEATEKHIKCLTYCDKTDNFCLKTCYANYSTALHGIVTDITRGYFDSCKEEKHHIPEPVEKKCPGAPSASEEPEVHYIGNNRWEVDFNHHPKPWDKPVPEYLRA
ncbi:hypothetical protein EC973_006897 [Apophysomyces ossiformis]|uniref:Uncharacterized protein n=1 Tax=Apophysomyces ossiformis TaxID=679940 RepID=A0A8H7BQG9_9FUNG|nr:hypothetical protein EC973_006897 [Apophysomyces ossiformis]